MPTKIEHELLDEIQVQYPTKYKVFLINDDYTPMDFVVDILMTLFHKSYQEAQNIMLEVHEHGKGLCGVYSFEIAETKVVQVQRKARESGFPLKAIMQEE